jgi:hypothetical protein
MVARRDGLIALAAVVVTVAGTWLVNRHQPAARPLDATGYLLAGSAALLLAFARSAPVAALAGQRVRRSAYRRPVRR